MGWRHFERFLDFRLDTGVDKIPFGIEEYARATYKTVQEARKDLMDYQRVSVEGGYTKYQLFRDEGTRTRNAKWLFGRDLASLKKISIIFLDDVNTKSENYMDSMFAMGTKNPAIFEDISVLVPSVFSEMKDRATIALDGRISSTVGLFEKIAYRS